jgi:hypothetical protein
MGSMLGIEPTVHEAGFPAMRLALALLVAMLLIGCSPWYDPSESPNASATAVEWPRCTNPLGFSISYPPGWFVHPADPSLNLTECRLFAKQPFSAEQDENGRWTGAQMALTMGTGCLGSFEVAVSERELVIQGFPAWVRELAFGEGPNAGEVSGYAYFINLRPGVACENGSWFIGRTESDAPGDYVANKRTVDEMIQSLDLSGGE